MYNNTWLEFNEYLLYNFKMVNLERHDPKRSASIGCKREASCDSPLSLTLGLMRVMVNNVYYRLLSRVTMEGKRCRLCERHIHRQCVTVMDAQWEAKGH